MSIQSDEIILDADGDPLPKTKSQIKKDLEKSRQARQRADMAAVMRKVYAKRKAPKQQIDEFNAREKIAVLNDIQDIANAKVNIIIDNKVKEEIETYYPALLETKPIGWQPFPGPQTDFLQADEFEVLFSGGRAPGKSDALLMDALRYCGHKDFRGLLIRKAMSDLRDLIRRAKEVYPMCYPGTKWKEQEKIFVFPSGAVIEMGYCDHEDDVGRYQGQEYTWLGIDELTQINLESTYEKLIASVRKSGEGLKNYIRCTTNPNGPGKEWVKRRWVDKGSANTTITISQEVARLNVTVKTTRKWIHGTVFDNPKVVENNPQYIAMLLSIDNEVLRRQWVEGDWDSADGLAFDEFERKVHVIKPFDIPSNWHKFRACDWGYKTKAVCLWFAIDYEGTVYVYREFISGGQTPRGALQAKQFGAEIKNIETEANEQVRYGILDASAWSQRGEDAPSPAEDMGGLTWRPSDRTGHSRKTGKLQVHKYLQKDEETGKPGVYIFDTCTDLIACISSLPNAKDDAEDVETNGNDHAYDAFRYGLMSRPKIYNNYSFANEQSVQPTIINSAFGY